MSVTLPISDNTPEDVAAFNRAADSAAGPEVLPATGVAGTLLDNIDASRTWSETLSVPVSATLRNSFTSTVPETEDTRLDYWGSARSTPRHSLDDIESTFPNTYRATIDDLYSQYIISTECQWVYSHSSHESSYVN